MFNSGVVGIDSADIGALDEALALSATLHPVEPVFNIEQFALTCALLRRTWVALCPEVVAHYWGPERRHMHAQIGALFPVFSRAQFEQHLERLPPIGYPPKRKLDQVLARLKGALRPGDGNYRFAYLAYRCALSSASRSPASADAWAGIAVDALNSAKKHRQHATRDFPRMLDAERHAWLGDDTKRRWLKYWDDARQTPH